MTCLKHVTLKHGSVTWISGRISSYSLCLEFVINQHFSRYCCLCGKQVHDWSKTYLVGLLIRSIFRWKNCTRAEALVQFFAQKLERINRPARHVLLKDLANVSSGLFPILSADDLNLFLSGDELANTTVNTRRSNNAIITSKRRYDVVLT